MFTMKIIVKLSKPSLIVFFVLFCNLTLIAQQQSQSYINYMSAFESYVDNVLFEKASAVLYSTEEVPSREVFIAFIKEAQKEMSQFHIKKGVNLTQDEQRKTISFIHIMLVELAEIYLDKIPETKVEERLDFLGEYLSAANLDQGIKYLTDDLTKALMMATYSAMKVPFGMPNNKVAAQISTMSGSQGELLSAASIKNNMRILAGSYEDSEKEVFEFAKSYINSTHLDYLKNGLISIERLKQGSDVYDFSFINLEGKKLSLSDYKDKVIYLDLWASWCAPCTNTFKTKTPDFEKQLKGHEDIVLMYLSVDDQEMLWRNYLDNNPMGGIQAYVGQGSEADIMKYFQVWGIPRYVIIGKGNKLYKVNAPRPGDEAVAALLEAKRN